MDEQRIWEITLCQAGTVRVHYETGSLHILKEGFLGLARELRDVADQIEARAIKSCSNDSLPSSAPPFEG